MEIYLDTGDLREMRRLMGRDGIAGLTTNPSLIKNAGMTDYRAFAREVLSFANGKPVSFEVFADDADGMEAQAREIYSWSDTCFVKIPITNTKGDSTTRLIQKLSREKMKLNITAITAHEQIRVAARSLFTDTPSIISVFCGRIADTGRDPVAFITTALNVKAAQTKVLWASLREVYNITQARAAGADIITVSPAILEKYLEQNGKDLNELSLMTVRQFHEDAKGILF